MTRYFSSWCSNCSTRVRVETEGSEPIPEVDTCPACDSDLISLDFLTGSGQVPYIESDPARTRLMREESFRDAAQHAAWHVRIRERCIRCGKTRAESSKAFDAYCDVAEPHPDGPAQQSQHFFPSDRNQQTSSSR